MFGYKRVKPYNGSLKSTIKILRRATNYCSITQKFWGSYFKFLINIPENIIERDKQKYLSPSKNLE
jgi:hypothetical protein